MNHLCQLIAAGLTCLFINLLAGAQEPEAYLRINTIVSGAGYAEIPDVSKYYFVEIYMPTALDQGAYNEVMAGRSKLGAIAEGNDEKENPVEISPNDCITDEAGKAKCSRTHFRIYLPKSIDTSKSYEVFFNSYPVSSTKVLRYRSIPIGLDYSTSLTTKDPGCSNSLGVLVDYADENAAFDPGKVPLRFLTREDRAAYDHYTTMRLSRVYDWLNKLERPELQLIDFRVRPLNFIIRPPATVKYSETQPGEFMKEDDSLWQPGEMDLPRLRVESMKPAQASRDIAVSNRFVLACIRTDKSLPTQEFNTKITIPTPINPPTELQSSLKKSGVAGVQSVASPAKPADEEVGERAIDQDLDIAFSFLSSVEEIDKPNPDPTITTSIKARERTTRGTLDLRINPLGTKPWFSEPKTVGIGPKARTTADYWLFTPLFIDSKVSTGKITKETLSLNRIVFGTQAEYQYLHNISPYPTYFRFIGRFSNASDRDFKQAEYRGTFEFRPIFGSLNHPLASIQAAQDRVLFGKDEDEQVYVNFTRGGYEIVPLVGGEVGRTWSRRNPADAVQPSETVKRLYGGLELTLTPLNRTTLTLSDTFYYNFGKVTKRRANYFIGSLDFLLGRFANSNRLAHSIFLSFEKGQQPPFSDSGVNVVKLGYRITGQRLFSFVGSR